MRVNGNLYKQNYFCSKTLDFFFKIFMLYSFATFGKRVIHTINKTVWNISLIGEERILLINMLRFWSYVKIFLMLLKKFFMQYCVFFYLFSKLYSPSYFLMCLNDPLLKYSLLVGQNRCLRLNSIVGRNDGLKCRHRCFNTSVFGKSLL